MANAFDAASANHTTSGTSVTDSHTATGSNLVAFIGVYVDSGDNLSTLTYAGSACTFITKIQLPSAGFLYTYYFAGPPTGAQNVIASVSGAATRIEVTVETYTGASQTGIPDASGTNSGSGLTSIAKSITTVADNAWLVSSFVNGTAAAASNGTNTTIRKNIGVSGNISGMGDSNGVNTPPGSYSQGVTWSGSTIAAIIVVSFAPAITTFTKSLSASVTATPSFSRTFTAIRALSASVTASASLSRVKLVLRILAASVTANGSLTKSVTYIRALTASVTATASLSMSVIVKWILDTKQAVSGWVFESRGDVRLWDDQTSTWDDPVTAWDSQRTAFGNENKNVVSLTYEPKNP